MSKRPTAEPTKPAWSMPIAVAEVPETGRHVDLMADASTRAAVAKVAGVAELPRLEAGFDLRRQGEGLHAAGHVRATVVQKCVVTLEPLTTEIDEPVDLLFMPQPHGEASDPNEMDSRGHDLEADDPPEAIINGTADLGAVAVEFLILGIDPYPRKPGAVFKPLKTDDPADHPFAALSALKKKENGG